MQEPSGESDAGGPRPPKRLDAMEEKLRGSLLDWGKNLDDVITDMMKHPSGAGSLPKEKWSSRLDRIRNEVHATERDLRTLDEDLKAAKSEADYRSVLVQSWPTSRLLNLLAGLGSAVLGAGSGAFLVGAQNAASRYWAVPAVLLWAVGAMMLVLALWGLSDWERKKWDFFAYQFSVPEEYRPMPISEPVGFILLIVGLMTAVGGIAYTQMTGDYPPGLLVALLGFGLVFFGFRLARARLTGDTRLPTVEPGPK